MKPGAERLGEECEKKETFEDSLREALLSLLVMRGLLVLHPSTTITLSGAVLKSPPNMLLLSMPPPAHYI